MEKCSQYIFITSMKRQIPLQTPVTALGPPRLCTPHLLGDSIQAGDPSTLPASLAGIQGVLEEQQFDLNTKGQKLTSE